MASEASEGAAVEASSYALALTPRQRALLREHVVQGVAILPGTAALALALLAARRAAGERVCLRGVRFEAALPVLQDAPSRLGWRSSGATGEFVVEALDGVSAGAHVRGQLARAPDALAEPPFAFRDDALQARFGAPHDGAEFYSRLRAHGNQYGPLFQGVERLWLAGDEALGRLRAGAAELTLAFEADVVALDAALHVLAARVLRSGVWPAFVLAEVAEVDLPAGARPAWSHVRIASAANDGDAPCGDVTLFDLALRPAGRLRGVRLAWLGARAQPQYTLALAATFTAEPVEATLEFWSHEFGLAWRPRQAPFNQVFQQLLDPGSLLRANREGAGVLLLRLEDWAAQERPAGEARPEWPSGVARRRLPNGLELAHLNAYETDYLYQEIFVDRVYARHGVTLDAGACVFDVGANIGLFSVWARSVARDVSVFAFEPSPRLAPLLHANARQAGGVRVFNCGVSDREGSASFTFYARSSVFSGFHADARQDEAALRAVIGNLVARGGLRDDVERQAAIEHFLAGRLEAEQVECPLRTLSSVIDECGLERIDLLKVDAEKSEWAVLAGLREEHWPRVRQAVLEIHDRSGAEVERLTSLLRGRGFAVMRETEELLDGSGLHTLYAVRPELRAAGIARSASARREERLDAACESFLEALGRALPALHTPLLLALCPASPQATQEPGFGQRLAVWEARLADAARALSGVDVIVPADVSALYPVDEVHDRQALELGHIPYTPAYFTALGSLLARRVLARQQPGVKVLAVDADDTLWNGIVGEVGALGVQIDAGRAALHEFLLDQVRAGRLLCVCSKNREEDVREVWRAHPGLRLREEHIAAWAVDWRPKSESLRALAQALGLGLETCVLLDDSPLECAEVAAFAPQVTALQLPGGSGAAARFVRHLWLLDTAARSDEDRRRTALYADEARRDQARRAAPDLACFLETLELRCDVAPLRPEDVERVAQLCERTNQFNLAKHERSPAEIRALGESGALEWLTVRVADRFGDYGLVGVLAFARTADALRVDTFLLSCRVLGRGVEQRLLAELGRRAESAGLAHIELPFVAAPRNAPARAFLEALRPHERRGSAFVIEACAAQAQRPEGVAPAAEAVPVAQAASVAEVSPALAQSDPRREPLRARRVAATLAEVGAIEAAQAARRRASQPGAGAGALRGTGSVRETVGALWSDVLGLDGLGLHDDFFASGGNSLLLVQAASRVGRAFGRRLPFDVAFKLRSVEAVAAWLETAGANESPAAPVVATADASTSGVAAPGPVSRAQLSLYYLHQLAPESWAYNIPFGALCDERLDAAALRRAFERLLERHALLQTSYTARKGQVLAVHSATAPDFAQADGTAWSPDQLRQNLRLELARPFDLRRGPVARLRVFDLAGAGSALLFVTHHIAVDLWSMEIVVDDLLRFYREELEGRRRPAPAPVLYADFVRWQQELLDGPEGERLWAYWQRELQGELPRLELPSPGPRLGARRFAGSSHAFTLDERLSEALRALAAREGSTLFQVLLAGYVALLSRHTAQQDLIVGAPFAARDPARFADVVGDFVNLAPLRLDLSGRPSFRELLRRVGARVLGALEHQDFPLPLMVQRLRLRSEPGRTPIVETTFALHEPNRLPELGAFFVQGPSDRRLALHGLTLRPAGLTQQEGQFDLALELVPCGRSLRGAFKYDADLLDGELARRLAPRYASLLAAAAEQPELPISLLPLGPDAPPSD